MIKYESPLISNGQIEQLRNIQLDGFQSATLPILFKPVASDDNANTQSLKNALDQLFADADSAISRGVNLLILSDRDIGPDKGAIPALLAVAGLHHYLIRQGSRTRVSLVLESGEPREVMHYALCSATGWILSILPCPRICAEFMP